MAKIDRVQEVSTELLKPYENNAKIHTEDQIKKIAESIKEFGFLNPCLIDKEYRILAGHGRVQAAKLLGMEKIPCVYVEGLNEAQRRAYILADNRLAELAEWNMEVVDQEIEELYGDGYDVTLTGFDYDDILAVENVRDDDFGIDDTDWEASPAQEAPKSKPRQIWQLGEHRLMCGDSTDPEDVAALMDGAQADLLLTDPPYNVDVGSCDRPNSQNNNVGILNDNMRESDFIQFLTSALQAAEKAMKPGAAFYVWYAGLKHIAFESAIRNVQAFKLHEQLIWVKAHFVLGRNSDYQWMHECCLYGWKEGAPHYFIDSRAETTVIEDRDAKLSTLKKGELIAIIEKYRNADRSTTILRAEKPNAAELHPTVKPQALLVEQIKNSSKRGGVHSRPVWWERKHDDRRRANGAQVLHDGVGSALLRRDYKALGRVHRQEGRVIMNALERHLDEIRDTEKQIRATQSKQRKYELHRHLAKLQKEYKTAKRNMKEGGTCRRV